MSAASLCVRPGGIRRPAAGHRRYYRIPEGDPGLMLTEIAAAEGGILVVGRSAASPWSTRQAHGQPAVRTVGHPGITAWAQGPASSWPRRRPA